VAHAQARFCYHTEGPPQDKTLLVFRVDNGVRPILGMAVVFVLTIAQTRAEVR